AWADADGPVAAACEEGLRALESAGARLVDVTLPHESVAPAVGALLIVSEACANLSDDRSRHARAYGDEITVTLAAMSGLSAEELLGAARVRTRLRETTAQLFRTQVDLLALPTTASVAPPIPRRRPADLLDPASTAALVRFTFLANLTGLPAGTAPVGRVGGLPVGLQLVGDAWDEASVIAGLAALERSGVGLMPPPRGHRHALA
ncbi:MAG: amidase, partial [Myxococcales bacterium]|nr:amidase [Myxococcales bacterium]